MDTIISKEEFNEIRKTLKKVHGHYFDDKRLAFNILNFIKCSEWNHRWGRKYAFDNTYSDMLKKHLDEAFGRIKNLSSRYLKVKHDLSQQKIENNRLKQLINDKKSLFLIEKAWVDPSEKNFTHGYNPVKIVDDEEEAIRIVKEGNFYLKENYWFLFDDLPKFKYTKVDYEHSRRSNKNP